MAKVLLINPNKWGRGITHIWIASHAGILKRNNHKVELFGRYILFELVFK